MSTPKRGHVRIVASLESTDREGRDEILRWVAATYPPGVVYTDEYRADLHAWARRNGYVKKEVNNGEETKA